MDFYIANEQLDAQIAEIKQKIRLSMNGVTADSMKDKGVIYKQNFGVELPVLREMAKLYSPSHDLAQRLWQIGGRETMILSVFLQPTTGFSITKALERVQSAQQKEIIDILCLYLLCKVTYAPQLCMELINTEHTNSQTAGYMLASRIFSQFSESQTKQIINKSVELSATDNYQLYISIGKCLGRLCRINTATAQYVLSEIENFSINGTPSQRAIISEVKSEMDFLNNL